MQPMRNPQALQKTIDKLNELAGIIQQPEGSQENTELEQITTNGCISLTGINVLG